MIISSFKFTAVIENFKLFDLRIIKMNRELWSDQSGFSTHATKLKRVI